MLGAPLARVVVERNVVTYRRQWIALVTGFFEPLFFLFSLGVGLGSLVGDLSVQGRPVSYAQFVAPALLATSAMNGAVFDATYGMFFKLRYVHTFDAMLATPVGPRDIAAGEVLWTLLRSGLYVTAFLLIATAMGLVLSWWALLAVPAAAVITFSFAAVGMAATTWVRGFPDFDFIQLALVPLLLLSATFYPAASYPASVRWLLQVSPLYHGVVVERALLLGDVGWHVPVHLAVLALLGAGGLLVLHRRLGRLLLR